MRFMRNENSLKNVFHLTLAGIICLYLTFDKQQEWDDSKNIASVKWNAAKMQLLSAIWKGTVDRDFLRYSMTRPIDPIDRKAF